ncbi:MAG TPA: methyltransferase domain-containing protein [Gemmataceae bacterium]|jgi:SAM-dependent methyltransferase|nr:methyltransferase domain-containing protein [Gemmataceae bacterium]
MPSAASVNHWPESRCAKAFWSQQELLPYRQLLADTSDWLDPRPGERWLDLGCGSGRLTRTLWDKSGGTLAELIALDCAQANAKSVQALRTALQPSPGDRLRFIHADFSEGLAGWGDDHFDGVVSGLAIQYAEFYSAQHGCWTVEAYNRLLAEVHRVLRPGGRFIFSVNVPEPSWGKVALHALPGLLFAPRLTRFLKNCLRMWCYGYWLKREARRGRFHYLPREAVVAKLIAVGFGGIEHRLSFAGQAYIFRCRKPG